MLTTLLRIERAFYADRQENAPLLKEREVFLEHLLQQGTSVAAARGVAWQLLKRYSVAAADSTARCDSL